MKVRRGHRFLRSNVGARNVSETRQLRTRSTRSFDDAIGRKVVRSVLEPASAPAPVKAEDTNVDFKSALKLGRGQQCDQSVDHRHAELGGIVDTIKVAPRFEGKKSSKRRLGST
jgi:hypothetical protein